MKDSEKRGSTEGKVKGRLCGKAMEQGSVGKEVNNGPGTVGMRNGGDA